MKPLVFLVIEHSVGEDWEDTSPRFAFRSSDAAYAAKAELERLAPERSPTCVMRYYEVRYLELL